MDFGFTEEQEERREKFFEVCEDLASKKPEGYSGLEAQYTEEGWEYHKYCAEEFGKRGWLSLGWPEEYGGQGDLTDLALFEEATGYYGLPGVDLFGVRILAPTLILMGTEEQKEKYLPDIASGNTMWCQLWSEPDAGSDLANASCIAEREDDHYILNGQKTWTTGAHRADMGFGVFKTAPEKPKRHNLSMIIVDMDDPGVEVNAVEYMDGTHMYNDVFFDDVRVPVSNRIGEENDGWRVTQVSMGWERSQLGGIAGMERTLERTVKYCLETEVDGEPLAEKPRVRKGLARIASKIEAARSLAYKVVDQQKKDQVAFFQPSAVKIYAGDLLREFAKLRTDILGPYGEIKTSKWAPLEGLVESGYQSYFVYTVSMGTNEIQRNIIAWYGLDLPRMYLVPSDEMKELEQAKEELEKIKEEE